jgi:hypothetical protein
LTLKIEKLIATLIAICAIVGLVVLLWSAQYAFGKISDFPEYYAAAKMIIEGKAPSIYVVSEIAKVQQNLFPVLEKRFIPIYIPPPALIFFIPIGLIGLPLAIYVWKSLLVLSLIGSVIFLQRALLLSYKQTCYLIAGVALSHACFEMLRIDQIAAFILLAFSAAVHFLQRKQDITAGLALSIMILKPQYIIPFLVYLIGLRCWRPVIMFACVGILLTVISYFVFGNTGFANYIALLKLPESTLYMQPELMPTLRGQLLRLAPSLSKEILYVSIAVFMSVAICSYFCGADNRNKNKNILWAVLITMPLTLITSLHCHSYDLLLLIPAILIIFMDTIIKFSPAFKLVIILGGIVFLIPLAIYIHYYYYLMQAGLINIWFLELLLLTAAIVFQVIRTKEAE